MSLHRKYHFGSHKTDFDCNAYQAEKPKKHFKSLVTVHMKLISPVPNPTTKFDKWTLSAKCYDWSNYLGKAMPCMSEHGDIVYQLLEHLHSADTIFKMEGTDIIGSI